MRKQSPNPTNPTNKANNINQVNNKNQVNHNSIPKETNHMNNKKDINHINHQNHSNNKPITNSNHQHKQSGRSSVHYPKQPISQPTNTQKQTPKQPLVLQKQPSRSSVSNQKYGPNNLSPSKRRNTVFHPPSLQAKQIQQCIQPKVEDFKNKLDFKHIQSSIESWKNLTLDDIIVQKCPGGWSKQINLICEIDPSKFTEIKPRKIIYKKCRDNTTELNILKEKFKIEDHQPKIYGIHGDIIIEEYVQHSNALTRKIMQNEKTAQVVAQQLADFHFNQNIASHLKPKHYNLDLVKNKNTEKYPHIKEKIKSFHIQNPILGIVASHNDSHCGNWIVPDAAPDSPILIDFEWCSLDFSGYDLGVILGQTQNAKNQEQRKKFLSFYLEHFFKKYLHQNFNLYPKYKDSTFEQFLDDIYDDFELECLKGQAFWAFRCSSQQDFELIMDQIDIVEQKKNNK